MSEDSSPIQSQNPIQAQIEVTEPSKGIVLIIAEHTGLNRAQVKSALDKGAVWIQRVSSQRPKRIRRVKARLLVSDKILINYDEKILRQCCLPAKLVADQGAYSVWVKPPGMLCQGSKWSDHTTIERWATKSLLPERPTFVVHRLDRMASGLILLAHTRTAAKHLAAQFEAREVTKRYRVLIDQQPKLELPFLIDSDLNGKPANTIIDSVEPSPTLLPLIWQDDSLVLERSSDGEQVSLSELNLRIESGRRHQIRQHLAGIGLPVVGDRLYHPDYQANVNNEEASLLLPESTIDLQLQSVEIGFLDPSTSQPVRFSV